MVSRGTNIKSVEKSASDGLTDTYTITYIEKIEI